MWYSLRTRSLQVLPHKPHLQDEHGLRAVILEASKSWRASGHALGLYSVFTNGIPVPPSITLHVRGRDLQVPQCYTLKAEANGLAGPMA